ncbi:MAG: hypothetical protein JWP40_3797 [Blastococcus sp.]|nr:hypothetical protein [Blastococcus sp.]
METTQANRHHGGDLLTKRETAAYLKVSVRTVERWTAAGILSPSRMSAHTVRYRRGDLAAFVSARQQPAA